MSSLGGILDSSLSALFAARVGMSTVSHNIANANTPGFSRQETLLAARQPQLLTYGAIGRGVGVDGVRRLTDSFLVANQRLQSARLGGYAQVDSALQEIEGIFGPIDGDHLGEALDRFFAAWSDLTTPSVDPTPRVAVAGAARALVADLRSMQANLGDVARDLDRRIETEVAGLNELLRQVAEINGQVLSAEIGGQSGNDLRDRRDLLLDRIAAMARVDAVERDDGTVDVIVAGRTLVTRSHAEQLDLQWSKTAGTPELSVVTAQSRKEIELPEGELAGLFAARDEQVGDVRQRLDGLARLIIDRVNELHVQGRADGGSGRLFFVGSDAATIDLNPDLADDPTLIATSRSGLSGDNDLAREIAALGGEGADSLTATYRALLGEVASRRGRFAFLLESQQATVESVQARIESVRGVSLDEEGANLMRYQQSYDAAARVITTLQEMFDTLLEM